MGEGAPTASLTRTWPAFEAALGMVAIHQAQAGLISDMDTIADVLYDRRK